MPRPHSAKRAEPAKTSLARSVRPSALTTTPSRVSFIEMLLVIVVACFFFTLSFSILLGRKDACARVARVSGWSPLVLGDFVSGARRAFVTGCI